MPESYLGIEYLIVPKKFSTDLPNAFWIKLKFQKGLFLFSAVTKLIRLKNPTPTQLSFTGSPMFMDPHPRPTANSMQISCMQYDNCNSK